MIFAHAPSCPRRRRFQGWPYTIVVSFLLASAHDWALPCSAASIMSFGYSSPGFSRLANAISADGKVVVGVNLGGPGDRGFKWTEADEFTSLGFLIANGTSADGSIAVGSGTIPTAPRNSAYLRNAQGEFVDLDMADPGSIFDEGGIPRDVSADGTVIVGRKDGQAARWTATGDRVLLREVTGGHEHSYALAVSGDGQTIVGHVGGVTGESARAMRWNSSGFQLIHDPNLGDSSSAADVSFDGSVIVGSSEVGPFRWTEAAGAVLLPLLPGAISGGAGAVSADGSVIGGSNLLENGEHIAVLWDAQGVVRSVQDILTHDFGLNLDGWTLRTVRDISADGRVLIGTGRSPTAGGQSWRAVLAVPEPAGWGLVALAGVLVSIARGRPRG